CKGPCPTLRAPRRRPPLGSRPAISAHFWRALVFRDRSSKLSRDELLGLSQHLACLGEFMRQRLSLRLGNSTSIGQAIVYLLNPIEKPILRCANLLYVIERGPVRLFADDFAI